MPHSESASSPLEYEAPSLVVLGTVRQLTALGIGATDEAENDGSQA